MLPKPDACRGCPLYGDGKGFVPDRLNDQAEVMVYAQNPGSHEEKGERWNGTDYERWQPEPLIGKTGYFMDTTFLPLAGLTRDQVSLGNSLRCRWRHTDNLPPLKSVRKALEHCHQAHFKLPEKTRLIVATGEYAMHALTQQGTERYNTLSDWRGYVLPFEPVGAPRVVHNSIFTPGKIPSPPPILVTYHLAYLFRDPTATLVTKMDWSKVPKLLRGSWPVQLPVIHDGPPAIWPLDSAFDTEFVPENRHFLCYSLFDGRRLNVSERLEPGILVHYEPHVIMQQSEADLPFLEKMLPRFTYDDTMHAHAVLWSDFEHNLNFLGSLYAPINRWKHLNRINPLVYSAGDAYGAWFVWKALQGEFDRDPASKRIYRDIQLRLVPIIRRAQERGIRVNTDVAARRFEQRQAIIDDLTLKAQAICGWPINPRSNDQMVHQLYEIEGLLDLIEGK